MDFNQLEKEVKNAFGENAQLVIQEPKENDDKRNPETRLEKFFEHCLKKKLVPTIFSTKQDQYEACVSGKIRGKKQMAYGIGVTIGLALNDVWKDMQRIGL